MTNRPPNWLLLDAEALDRVKRVAAQYQAQIPAWHPTAHNVEAEYIQVNSRFAQAGSNPGGTPTWLGAENADIVVDQNGVGDYDLQLYIAIEMGVSNADLGLTEGFRLQYRIGTGGTWTYVDAASDAVNMVADSGMTDGGTIGTAVVTGTGSYVAGEQCETDDTSDTITFTTNSYTNLVWSLKLVDTSLNAGDDIYFRVVEDDGTVMTNEGSQNYPIVSWTNPTVNASYDQGNFRFAQANSSVSAPTWEAAQAVDLTLEEDSAGDYSLQVWFSVLQTVSTANALLTDGFTIESRLNGGAWTDVDSAAWVNMNTGDTGFTDGDPISSSQVTGTGSYVTGIAEEATDDTGTVTFATEALSYTNLCWAVTLVDAQLAAGDFVEFRVTLDDGTALANAGTADIPRIDWDAAPVPIVEYHVPPKPPHKLLPVRRDGIWRGIHRVFGHLQGSPLTELVGGRLGEFESATSHTIEEGVTLFDPTIKDNAGGNRLVYELDPNGRNETVGQGNTEALWPTHGITFLCLIYIDSATHPSSTSILQRYNGLSGQYPWRILIPGTSNAIQFEADLDSTLRSTPTVTMPQNEWIWLVGRWTAGEVLRGNIYRLDGQAIGSDVTTAGSFNVLTYEVGDTGPPDTHYDALWGDSNSAPNGYGAAAFVWDRKLEDDELALFFSNPWDFYDLEVLAPAFSTTPIAGEAIGTAVGSSAGPKFVLSIAGEAIGTTQGQTDTTLLVAQDSEAVGTAVGSAAVDLPIAIDGEAIGTAVGSATETLTSTLQITGEAVGTAVGSAAFDLPRAVDGEAIGTAVGVGTVQAAAVKAGEAIATAVGVATVLLGLSASGEAVGTAVGAAAFDLPLAVSSEGIGTTVGAADFDLPLQIDGEAIGTAVGVATPSGFTLQVDGEAIGTAVGTTDPDLVRAIDGEAVGTTAQTTDVDLVQVVAGEAVGTTASAAAFDLLQVVAGEGVGTTNGTALVTLGSLLNIAGEGIGTAVGTVDPDLVRAVDGEAIGTTVASSDVDLVRAVAGEAVGTTAGTTDVDLGRALTGEAVGTTLGAGLFDLVLQVAGEAVGTTNGTALVTLGSTQNLAGEAIGTAVGSATVQAVANLDREAIGTTVGSAIAVPTLILAVDGYGSTSGTALVTLGSLVNIAGEAIGTTAGAAAVEAVAVLAQEAVGTALGTATALPVAQVAGDAVGTALGTASVDLPRALQEDAVGTTNGFAQVPDIASINLRGLLTLHVDADPYTVQVVWTDYVLTSYGDASIVVTPTTYTVTSSWGGRTTLLKP